MPMVSLNNPLALHTWTLDTTELSEVLRVAHETGYEGIELRPQDFDRLADVGVGNSEVIRLIRESGLAVSTVATLRGWMWAEGEQLTKLLDRFRWACATAKELGTDMIISPVDPTTGDVAQAIARTREVSEIAASMGVKLALQMNSWAQQLNRLDLVTEIINGADHPALGYLLDTYHLERTGAGGRGFAHLPAEKIFHIQVSDVPPGPRRPGVPLDRLPPGDGIARLDLVMETLAEKNYRGWIVYEAPNPALWAREPAEVAREGLERLRRLMQGLPALPPAAAAAD